MIKAPDTASFLSCVALCAVLGAGARAADDGPSAKSIIARTPDGSWTNWSIARIMVVDKTRMSGIVAPNQPLGMIHKMWKRPG